MKAQCAIFFGPILMTDVDEESLLEELGTRLGRTFLNNLTTTMDSHSLLEHISWLWRDTIGAMIRMS